VSDAIFKFPRTRHVEGSGVQLDDDLEQVPWSELSGHYLVIEEKLDGANCGVSFDASGRLRLQSRGHLLTGGPRERQFALLKGWAGRYRDELHAVLGSRYVLYGEWLYGKHTVFYTDLPHYLLEFDILDTQSGAFLSTMRRAELLAGAPMIASVPVLHTGPLNRLKQLVALVGPSRCVAADAPARLADVARAMDIDPEQAVRESDVSGLMEGLYIKVEDGEYVHGRYKYVRPGFLQTVIDSGSHWLDRPLIPNQLRAGVELWS